MRRFIGVELNEEAIPDETTILNFRRLLETHALAPKLFATINAHLSHKGLLLREGTIVDATIIHAPSSTKNEDHTRDPEMHQTKKGNQYFFGMKAHIGVDYDSGLVHSVKTTAANVADVTQASQLLHGEESFAYGDAGYAGVAKREENHKRAVRWEIAARPGTIRAMPEGKLKAGAKRVEYCKARITIARTSTLNDAFAIHPERFKGKRPTPPIVPDKVYINPPLKKEIDIPKTH